MPDPCQSFVDKVASIQALIKSLPKSSLDKPEDPGEATALYAKLTTAQTELATCQQAHLPVTVTGASGGNDWANFDQLFKSFMFANGVNAGQLTVIKDGKVQFAHAYTPSFSPYPTTQTDSLFRIASCSKAFTCAAIQNLYDAGSLKPDDRVFPLLGINSKALPSQIPDPNIDAITVQNLIDHAGGWVSSNFVIPLDAKIPGYLPGMPVF